MHIKNSKCTDQKALMKLKTVNKVRQKMNNLEKLTIHLSSLADRLNTVINRLVDELAPK